MFRSDLLGVLVVGSLIGFNILIEIGMGGNNFPLREAGASLEGYWYTKESGHGCYLQATVYQIRGKEFNAQKVRNSDHQRKIIYNIESVDFGDNNIVTIRLLQNLIVNNSAKIYKKYTTITAQDLGDRLIPIQSINELDNQTKDVTDQEPTLFHCSHEPIFDTVKYALGFRDRTHPNRLDET